MDDEEKFENQVAEMVNEADKMARRYEFSIRKGKFEEEPPYEKIIDIYKEIREMLLNKGWKSQAMIYYDQIKLYEGKVENDRRLRETEVQKELKGKQIEEMLKSKKVDTKIKLQKVQELESKKKEKELRPYIKTGKITEQEMRRIIKDEFLLDILASQQFFKRKKHSGRTIVS